MTPASATTPRKLLTLIAGGSSASGVATAKALTARGHRVISVGSSTQRITAATAGLQGVTPMECDLADLAAVAALAETIHRDFGPVDGLIQLVGGWRGGGTLAEQSDADWDFLADGVLTTLRNTTRVFGSDLEASPHGRLVIVSSTGVTKPTAANANYVTVKAAAEAWTLAAAEGFSHSAPHAAAVVLVVKALVDSAMRAAAPERKFPGFTEVETLGAKIAELFDTDAASLNGARIDLSC